MGGCPGPIRGDALLRHADKNRDVRDLPRAAGPGNYVPHEVWTALNGREALLEKDVDRFVWSPGRPGGPEGRWVLGRRDAMTVEEWTYSTWKAGPPRHAPVEDPVNLSTLPAPPPMPDPLLDGPTLSYFPENVF